MRKTYRQGFTLIEILFVIAILSVIASLGISVLQQRAQQLKVERTALQMQQILQAGMAFKADSSKSEWPVCGDPDSDFSKKYLPTGLTGNPWGYPYECYKNGDKTTFIVKVKVPNDKIVDQIKALLPNAGAIAPPTTPPTVFTEVSGTGGGTTTEKTVFRDVGYLEISNAEFGTVAPNIGVYTKLTPIVFDTVCPSNMEGHLLFLPKDLVAGDYMNSPAQNGIKQLKYDDGCSTTTAGDVSCSPRITFTANHYHSQGSGSVSLEVATNQYLGGVSGHLYLNYISYCKRK